MTDRETVISLVEDAIEVVEKEAFWTIANGLRDALDLLKEQEPVEPIIVPKVFQCARCGKCGQLLHWCGNYCHWCGQAVKWE